MVLRKCSRPLVLFVLALSLVVAGPAGTAAAGGSAAAIAQNAWIISDLAADVANSGYSPVTEAEQIKYGAATTAGATATNFKPKPKPGIAGLVVNSVAVFGSVALLWGGGEDDLPEVAPGSADQSAGGSEQCGWVQGSDFAFTRCNYAFSSIQVGVARTGAGNTFDTSCSGCSHYAFNTATQEWSSIGTNLGDGFGNYGSGGTWTFEIYRSTTGTVAGATALVGRIHVKHKNDPTIVQPDATPDPALVPRYIDSSITCKSPGGGSQVFTEREGPFFLDPSIPDAPLPEVPDMVCPEGTWLDSGTRVLATEGSTKTIPLMEPYVRPDWVPEQAEQFPDCWPVGMAKCLLELTKIRPGLADLRCSSIEQLDGHPCRSWFTDPNRSSNYKCSFGPYPVPMKQCEPYKDRYDLGVTTGTPSVETPQLDPDADPTPEDTPGLGTCVPSWASLLTPWWVFKSTACALRWGFVPQTALSVQLERLKGAFEDKFPFSVVTTVVNLPAGIGGGSPSECPDWRVKVSQDVGPDLDSNVVCNSSYTAAVLGARPFLLAGMLSVAFWPLFRGLFFASVPVIKPVPTDGK